MFDDDNIHSVESISNHKIVDNQWLLHIKWEGYPVSESTWEPLSTMMEDIREMVEEYFANFNMHVVEKKSGKQVKYDVLRKKTPTRNKTTP